LFAETRKRKAYSISGWARQADLELVQKKLGQDIKPRVVCLMTYDTKRVWFFKDGQRHEIGAEEPLPRGVICIYEYIELREEPSDEPSLEYPNTRSKTPVPSMLRTTHPSQDPIDSSPTRTKTSKLVRPGEWFLRGMGRSNESLETNFQRETASRQAVEYLNNHEVTLDEEVPTLPAEEDWKHPHLQEWATKLNEKSVYPLCVFARGALLLKGASGKIYFNQFGVFHELGETLDDVVDCWFGEKEPMDRDIYGLNELKEKLDKDYKETIQRMM